MAVGRDATPSSSGQAPPTSRRRRVLVRHRVADGVGQVDVVAPASTTARQTSRGRPCRSGSRPRTRTRPRRTSAAARRGRRARCATTSSGSSPSFRSMWTGLVPRTTWIAGAARPRAPRRPRRRRRRRARQRGDRGPRAEPATARTPSKSPGEEAANPASITSTPSRSSARRSPPWRRARARCPALLAVSQRRVEDGDPARTPFPPLRPLDAGALLVDGGRGA